MSIISNGSANVEQEPLAGVNNFTIPESTSSTRSVFESCRKNKTKPHAFSKKVAEIKIGKEKLGLASSLLLRFLAHMLHEHGVQDDGKKWIRMTLDTLAAQYPYMARGTVDNAVLRLKNVGACEIEDLNLAFGRPRYDRARNYHVPKKWADLAEEELRYFYPPLATLIGVPAAVIHHNFMHWVDELQDQGAETMVQLQPADLMIRLPFAKATIKRAIAMLIQKQLLYPVPGKRCYYAAFPIIQGGSKLDKGGSNLDKGGSKLDESGSKLDNDSIVSNIIVSLEENSKTQAAPASKGFASSDKETMQDKDIGLEQKESLSPFSTNSDTENSDDDKDYPIIHDFAELHSANRSNVDVVASIEQDTKQRDSLIASATSLVEAFLYTLEGKWADQLYDEATDEELFDALFLKYQQFARKVFVNLSPGLFGIFYYGIFQCIIGAFLRIKADHKHSHPIGIFNRVQYRTYLYLWERAEERRVKAIEQENAELQKQFASPDHDDEWRQALSPAKKARVFKQALYCKNKVGCIFLGGERRTEQILITKDGLRDVQTLFDLNPLLTPGDLLKVMDACMALHAQYPPVPEKFQSGIKWHARMGHKLWFFARYLRTILKQLDITIPITNFLNTPNDESEVEEEMIDEPLVDAA